MQLLTRKKSEQTGRTYTKAINLKELVNNLMPEAELSESEHADFIRTDSGISFRIEISRSYPYTHKLTFAYYAGYRIKAVKRWMKIDHGEIDMNKVQKKFNQFQQEATYAKNLENEKQAQEQERKSKKEHFKQELETLMPQLLELGIAEEYTSYDGSLAYNSKLKVKETNYGHVWIDFNDGSSEFHFDSIDGVKEFLILYPQLKAVTDKIKVLK